MSDIISIAAIALCILSIFLTEWNHAKGKRVIVTDINPRPKHWEARIEDRNF